MNMLRKSVRVSGLGLFSLISLFWVAQSLAAAPALTRTHAGGGVTAKATYLNPGGTEDTRFEISLDTHSVDLDSYDLKSLSSLRDDAGKVFRPSKVENKGSGHHRQFVLVFPKAGSGEQAARAGGQRCRGR